MAHLSMLTSVMDTTVIWAIRCLSLLLGLLPLSIAACLHVRVSAYSVSLLGKHLLPQVGLSQRLVKCPHPVVAGALDCRLAHRRLFPRLSGFPRLLVAFPLVGLAAAVGLSLLALWCHREPTLPVVATPSTVDLSVIETTTGVGSLQAFPIGAFPVGSLESAKQAATRPLLRSSVGRSRSSSGDPIASLSDAGSGELRCDHLWSRRPLSRWGTEDGQDASRFRCFPVNTGDDSILAWNDSVFLSCELSWTTNNGRHSATLAASL